MGLSELSAFTAETWGCSLRQARDVVAAAHKAWLDACYGSEEIDLRDGSDQTDEDAGTATPMQGQIWPLAALPRELIHAA